MARKLKQLDKMALASLGVNAQPVDSALREANISA